jgi:AraC family transcriptional regulator
MSRASNPVQQAIWYIESHFSDEVTLDRLATVACVSKFHLVRAFGSATGYSPMQYLRARRLSVAAQRLAHGEPDILSLALDANYGSHEAFTRAFGEQFGLAPEALRTKGNVAGLHLTQPMRLDETIFSHEVEPRYVLRDAFLLAGVNEMHDYHSSAGVPAQWQRFSQEVAPAPSRQALSAGSYGVLHNQDDAGTFDYLCGAEVRDFSRLAGAWYRLRVPAQRYAVFPHEAHVSAIRRTWFSIWNRWIPDMGLVPAAGIEFEHYGPGFDPHAGEGHIEIWVPIN